MAARNLLRIFMIVCCTIPAFAKDEPEIDEQIATTPADKMTIREAKGICKKNGKKGKDLVLCIKEKIRK